MVQWRRSNTHNDPEADDCLGETHFHGCVKGSC
jgi:hypothetical protein